MKINTIISRFIFIGFILSTIVSCNNRGNKLASKSESKLKLDSIVVVDSIPLLKDTASPACKLTIRFVYPTQIVGDSSLLKKIQADFVTAMYGKNFSSMSPQSATSAFIEKFSKDFKQSLSNYDEAKSSGMDMKMWGDTYQIMQCDTVASDSTLLSFKTYVENFNGGAHGSHQTSFYNINLKTGAIVTATDLFVSGYEAKLKQVLIAKLIADNNVKDEDGLVEKGFFDPNEMKLTDNFLIQRHGILFGFNEYEIAPYVMGFIKIFLPYKTINGILCHPKAN